MQECAREEVHDQNLTYREELTEVDRLFLVQYRNFTTPGTSGSFSR